MARNTPVAALRHREPHSRAARLGAASGHARRACGLLDTGRVKPAAASTGTFRHYRPNTAPGISQPSHCYRSARPAGQASLARWPGRLKMQTEKAGCSRLAPLHSPPSHRAQPPSPWQALWPPASAQRRAAGEWPDPSSCASQLPCSPAIKIKLYHTSNCAKKRLQPALPPAQRPALHSLDAHAATSRNTVISDDAPKRFGGPQ